MTNGLIDKPTSTVKQLYSHYPRITSPSNQVRYLLMNSLKNREGTMSKMNSQNHIKRWPSCSFSGTAIQKTTLNYHEVFREMDGTTKGLMNWLHNNLISNSTVASTNNISIKQY